MNWSFITATLTRAFDWVWTTSLHASVLMALVFAIRAVFGKRLPARLSYALGLLVLVRLVLPIVPAARFSVFNLWRDVEARPIPEAALLTAAELQPAWASPEILPAVLFTTGASLASGSGISLRTFAGMVWMAGLLVSLIIVVRRDWKFARWVRSQAGCADHRVNSLLQDCRATMRVRRKLALVVAPNLMTPALFGWLRPRLLVPEEMLAKLDERELRMVFLHEVAHLKRGDILLNWILFLVRSLHWFNPLVWLALRRLRADRELVCDAVVLARLCAEDRPAYGHTLIRLLDDFSGAGFCPSLTPIINHKSEIKRRIIMIARFKPAGRVVLLLSAAVVVALCCFTFTRAAEKKPVLREASPATQGPRPTADAGRHSQTDPATMQSLDGMRRKFAELSDRVHQAEARVDELRHKLGISGVSSEGAHSLPVLEPQTVRFLEEQRIRAQAEYNGLAGLLEGLLKLRQEKGEGELRKSILTAVNDDLLCTLMKDLSATEATLAMMKETMGLENPEFKSKAAMQADLDEKINQRINGILAGLKVRIDAFHANLDSLAKSIDGAREKDIESGGRYRIYIEARRDLENLQRVRDALYLRILEREYGVEVPRARAEESH